MLIRRPRIAKWHCLVGGGMRRRDFVSATAALAAAKAFPSFETLGQTAPAPELEHIVDAHCHVFNAADLPVEGFIEKVVLADPSQNAQLVSAAQHYPGAVVAFIHALALVVRPAAPSSQEEIDLIDQFERDPAKKPTAVWRAERDIETLKKVLDTIWNRRDLFRGLPPIVGEVGYDAVDTLKLLLYRELHPDFGQPFPTGPGERQELQSAPLDDLARTLYASSDSYGHYTRWALLFTHYRYELAETLAQLHRRAGQRQRLSLLAPAIVDFAKWLDDDPRMSLAQQTAVMTRIARRKIDDGPRVHGFIGFDPLRKALYDRGKHKADESDPLAIVRTAIEADQSPAGGGTTASGGGFVGVKLYPPMGFQASGNAAIADSRFPVPQFIRSDAAGLGSQIGAKLDAALSQLYGWCAPNNVPIMAHTNNTFGQNQDYRDRANPQFWRSVVKTYPNIRINLAHFGHFNRAVVSNQGIKGVEDCWEWITGDIFNSFPDSYVFADVSSLSEILKFDSSQKLLACMKVFKQKYPNSDRHLMYGTDWSFVGLAEGFPSIGAAKPYPDIMVTFLKAANYSDEQIKNIMFRNSARFLGISKAERDKFGDNCTRGRLEKFYATHNLKTDWMTAFDS
jgi:predicted TIM-barrel fold metal-dependent hydrolase